MGKKCLKRFKQKKNSTNGGSCCLQQYTCGNAKKPLILTIVTPLMSTVHLLPQSSEMAFLDASSSLDRYNNQLFFLSTHHPSGSLPGFPLMGHWILIKKAYSYVEVCITYPTCIWGKRTKYGPRLFMTNDNAAENGALQNQWPDSTQLLCIFHFLHTLWGWFWDSKHEIKKKVTENIRCRICRTRYLKILDTVALAYPNFLKHVKDCYATQEEWPPERLEDESEHRQLHRIADFCF